MRRIIGLVAVTAAIATGCAGGGGTPVAGTTSPAPAESPSPTPTPRGTPLSAKDRLFLKELAEEPGQSSYASDQEAIAAAKNFCEALERGDKRGSIDLQLSDSFLALVVNEEAEIDIAAFQHALRFYCPKFDHLIKEYPAP